MGIDDYVCRLGEAIVAPHAPEAMVAEFWPLVDAWLAGEIAMGHLSCYLIHVDDALEDLGRDDDVDAKHAIELGMWEAGYGVTEGRIKERLQDQLAELSPHAEG